MGCGTSIAIENQTRPSETGKINYLSLLLCNTQQHNLLSLLHLQQPWIQQVCIINLLKNMALHLVSSSVLFFLFSPHPQGFTQIIQFNLITSHTDGSIKQSNPALSKALSSASVIAVCVPFVAIEKQHNFTNVEMYFQKYKLDCLPYINSKHQPP